MNAEAVEAAGQILLAPDVGVDRLHVRNAAAVPQEGALSCTR